MEERHITDSFETFFVRPSGLQYTIDQLPWIIIILIGLISAGTESCPYRKYVFYGVFVLLAYLYYRAFEFRRIAYIVTGEQLIYQHGVFFHKSDYMELYRIVDYQESRTPMQQLTGLKNVTLLSGDRSLPKLTLRGIKRNMRIIDNVRTRVEYNKKRRGIYEITNRF
jgi:membrane protein YdbS with pleckstrin-like domain